jgi:tetratricopeptide (TPR) repeat protein
MSALVEYNSKMKFSPEHKKPTHPVLTGFLGLAGVLIVGLIIFLLPPVNRRLGWRVEYAGIYLRGMINPIPPMATPMTVATLSITETTPTPTTSPTGIVSQTAAPTTAPTPTATPIPPQVRLASPAYEREDLNNCGPAALAMNLKVFGWQGDQYTISDEIKPIQGDRNVNVEELQYYVRNFAGYLKTEYRVGGDINLLKRILASGLPVMIEEGYTVDKNYWPNDDRWAGHYLLINGYNDETQTFLTQDVFVGPNVEVKYSDLDKRWQSFNRVYIMVYPADKEEELKQVLGADWDVDANRKKAQETALAETKSDPGNVYAWFNLGSNLVYFERYDQASLAYDTARKIGFPQRMLRYQFGPFLAYFHSLRTDDLLTLTENSLQRTPNAEEALLWEGWAQYRLGNKLDALSYFQKALDARPGYADAEYALEYARTN